MDGSIVPRVMPRRLWLMLFNVSCLVFADVGITRVRKEEEEIKSTPVGLAPEKTQYTPPPFPKPKNLNKNLSLFRTFSFVAAAELGDYDPEEQAANYVSEFKLVLNQSAKLERDVMAIHKSELRGQTPAQAELNFLKKSCVLETYGLCDVASQWIH